MRISKIIASLALAAILGTGLSACDTTATFRISEVQFDPVAPMRVIAATPIRLDEATQSMVPACSAGEPVDGFRMTFALKSTEQKGSAAGNKDRLVRENDRVSGKTVTVGPGEAISADKFSFGQGSNTLEKVQSLDNVGNALPSASAQASKVTFTPRSESRNAPIAVALLIDHSGSMVGYVDPSNYFETKTQVGAPIDERTDKFQHRFGAAGTSFIANLNSSDKLITWTFNEDGLRLPCTAVPSAATEPLAAEENCFTTNHGLYYDATTGTGGITTVSNDSARGRTPLWRAVHHAWEFLNASAPELPKHIVVLSDSPDTCSSAGDWWIQDEACAGGASVDYLDFKAVVDATNPTVRIPVSFIQVQSKGYQAPDPAQMEAACLTGGTHQWINNLNFAQDGVTLLRELRTGFENIRDTLSGVWHLDVNLGVLADTNYIRKGQVAAIQGLMTLSGTGLLPTTATVQFVPPPAANDADSRLLVRTSCSTQEDCPGGDALGQCDLACLPEGSACAPANMEPRLTNLECCCGEPVTDFESLGESWTCGYFQAPCCTIVDKNDPKHVDQCSPSGL